MSSSINRRPSGSGHIQEVSDTKSGDRPASISSQNGLTAPKLRDEGRDTVEKPIKNTKTIAVTAQESLRPNESRVGHFLSQKPEAKKSKARAQSESFAERALLYRNEILKKPQDDLSANISPRSIIPGGRTTPIIPKGLEHETGWNAANEKVAGKAYQSHYAGNASRPDSGGLPKPPTKMKEIAAHAKEFINKILMDPQTTVQFIGREKGDDSKNLARGNLIDYRLPSGLGVRYAETPMMDVPPRQPNDPPTRNTVRTLVGFLNPSNR